MLSWFFLDLGIFICPTLLSGFPGGWDGKEYLQMKETQVWSLGWGDLWRREWLPTPVFLPGEFHGQRSLVSYSPGACKESETTEKLTLFLFRCILDWCPHSQKLSRSPHLVSRVSLCPELLGSYLGLTQTYLGQSVPWIVIVVQFYPEIQIVNVQAHTQNSDRKRTNSRVKWDWRA